MPAGSDILRRKVMWFFRSHKLGQAKRNVTFKTTGEKKHEMGNGEVKCLVDIIERSLNPRLNKLRML